MRKPKISDQYDEESYVKGFKKGWGQCFGIVLGYLREEFPLSIRGTDDHIKEYVLTRHPYHSLRKKAKNDE